MLLCPALETVTGLEALEAVARRDCSQGEPEMKMIAEHFEPLKTSLLETINTLNVKPNEVTSERDMWNVLHLARQNGRINLMDLYRDYNDAHILTAMRQIFR
jgi:hypothetical protein